MFFRSKRIAFVAGVQDYDHLRKLKWSGNDAREVSRQLKMRNFVVVESFDEDWATMDKKLTEFLEKSGRYDIGLIYFSGHGLQSNDENYLFARDAQYYPVEGKYKAIPFSDVFETLCEKTDKSVAILDACRELPKPPPPDPAPVPPAKRQRPRRPVAAEADARLAGAPADPVAARREKFPKAGEFGKDDSNRAFIAYACDSEELSYEGPGPLSYYTTALVDQIDIPGKPIRAVFDQVSADVVKATHNSQEPWNSSHRANFALRPRSWLPIIALPLLAFGLLFVARALSEIALFSSATFAAQSVFVGLAAAALFGFATWRWGGEEARGVLVGAMTLLMWGVLAFFYERPGWCSGPCPVDRVAILEIGAATLLTVLTMSLLFLEIRPLRTPWVLLPIVLVPVTGTIAMLVGNVPVPLPGAGSLDLTEGFYTKGMWILPFALGLGICITFMDYDRSNWRRRILGTPERRDQIFRAALFALIAGFVAMFSGPALPPENAEPGWTQLFVLTIGEVDINVLPGLALAATFGFVMWQAPKYGSWRSAGMAFAAGIGLWVLVLWLAQGMLDAAPEQGAPIAGPNDAAPTTLDPWQPLYVILSSALILGFGLLSFGAMMTSRLWRVPVWLLSSIAIVLGLAPYAILRVYFVPAYEATLPLNVVLLYCPWLVAFASVVAYGLTVQKPRQYGNNIK